MREIISAIATPRGRGGVAIIRLSGEGCLSLAQKMFKPTSASCAFEPYRMYSGAILCDGFEDFGFLVYFAAPRSFTGEDVVEFHCHGGPLIAEGVLKRTLSLGARAADRGEFTRRAFLNGKLSLSSAEGMADMINAESSALLRAGGLLYREKLTEKITKIQRSLKDILAAIAVEIDYPEEDEDGLDLKKTGKDIEKVLSEINQILRGWTVGEKIKNGVSVAICGSPNVGKSSLLNALLGYEKAIVSPIAGTTRDAVEGRIEIGGILFDLIDTAGLRERAGSVEAAGIERAKRAALTSDIALFVSDCAESSFPQDVTGKIIRVFNKCDKLKPEGEYDIVLSAKTGEGLEKLRQMLYTAATAGASADGQYLIEERHFSALSRAAEALKDSLSDFPNTTCDLISVDLKEAWDCLGEITGETASEEIIDTVFEKFCVGK